jgi:4-hydroxymandelate oxidase
MAAILQLSDGQTDLMKPKKMTRRSALAGVGSLAATASLTRADDHKLIGEAPGRIAPRNELVNALEFADVAERMLSPLTFAKISGSDRSYFDRITLRPRLCVDCEKIDLTADVFGQKLFTPIVVGPISKLQQYHPEGEVAMAKGAAAAKTVMIVSSDSSQPIDKIAAEAKAGFWFQIFPEDVAAARTQIQQAVSAGCKAVMLTAGAFYRDRKGAPVPSKLAAAPLVDWSVVDQLRQGLTVPFVIKGIMSPEEADAAAKRGIQGIVVSDYGGLLTRGLAPPMETLPAVVDAVNGRIPVLVDGNFRRGSDIFKALAFGAKAALLARPCVWGLAAYGAPGVQTVLELIQTDLGRNMAMCGKINPAAIDRTAIKVHQV